MISVPRGRPAKTLFASGDGDGLGSVIAELEAAMAAADRLLAPGTA